MLQTELLLWSACANLVKRLFLKQKNVCVLHLRFSGGEIMLMADFCSAATEKVSGAEDQTDECFSSPPPAGEH